MKTVITTMAHTVLSVYENGKNAWRIQDGSHIVAYVYDCPDKKIVSLIAEKMSKEMRIIENSYTHDYDK